MEEVAVLRLFSNQILNTLIQSGLYVKKLLNCW